MSKLKEKIADGFVVEIIVQILLFILLAALRAFGRISSTSTVIIALSMTANIFFLWRIIAERIKCNKCKKEQKSRDDKVKEQPTFGVSAIVLDEKNNILLLNDKNGKKQPGSVYRFHECAGETENPYDKVRNCIAKEAQVSIEALKPIGVHPECLDRENEPRKIASTKIWTNSKVGSKGERIPERENRLCPSPLTFLLEGSGQNLDIRSSSIYDMFYVFKIERSEVKNRFCEWRNLIELTNICDDQSVKIYRDLFVVYSMALEQTRTENQGGETKKPVCNSEHCLTLQRNADLIENDLKHLKLDNSMTVVAFDFDQLIVQAHLTLDITSQLSAPKKKSINPHDFNGLYYLDGLMSGVQYDAYAKIRDEIAANTSFRFGFDDLIKDLLGKVNVVVISSGLKDICYSKLKEVDLEETQIIAGELLAQNGVLLGSKKVISSEDKGDVINHLKKRGYKTIAVGHSRGDEYMVSNSDVGIVFSSKEIRSSHHATNVEELKEIIEKHI